MKTILGLDIVDKPFEHERDLPLYFKGNYTFRKVSIAGFDCILMAPRGNMGTAESIKKHMARVKQVCGIPVAINPKELSAFRRKSLLENRIPFVTEKQVYLPYLGTYLEDLEEVAINVDAFTVSAQVALIKWLLNPIERVRVADLMEDLGYTTMTQSRVARQLGATDCFTIEKDGASNVLTAKYTAKETFDKLKDFMFSPVEQTGYVDLPTDMDITVAGIEALSERTMLGPDRFHTYAVFKADKKSLRHELVDPERQAYVEIWKYDPAMLLWEDGMADPVSVALSLRDNKDERVEGAVEDMLNEVWR